MDASILTEYLPTHIWNEVKKQAQRTTLNSFKTGAIIFDEKTYKKYGWGCSHVPESTLRPSVHAEEHAIRSIGKFLSELKSLSIVIYTLGKTGNMAYSSRPCLRCAGMLLDCGIQNVYY